MRREDTARMRLAAPRKAPRARIGGKGSGAARAGVAAGGRAIGGRSAGGHEGRVSLTVAQAGAFLAARETHLPTPQHPPRAKARLPRPHGHERGPQGAQEPAPQGSPAPGPHHLQEVARGAGHDVRVASCRLRGADVGLGFGKDRRLRRHAEFVHAKRLGRRVGTAHFTLLVAPQPGEALAPRASASWRPERSEGPSLETGSSDSAGSASGPGPDLLPAGVDLIVIARPGAPGLALTAVRSEWGGVERLLRRRAEEALARARTAHHPGGD